MIRPINTVKPPPPPRVDPKANAEQITRLQAEATKLQNEIRLANKMGEADAAAGARQRLTQVNAELTTAQPTAPRRSQDRSCLPRSPRQTAMAAPPPRRRFSRRRIPAARQTSCWPVVGPTTFHPKSRRTTFSRRSRAAKASTTSPTSRAWLPRMWWRL